MTKEDEMAIGIGTRVRITHKPEHDRTFNTEASKAARARLHGRDGEIARGEGAFFVSTGDDGAWFEPDELTEIASVPALLKVPTCGEAAAEVIAEMRANPTNPILQDLRDEPANEKAAHAEAERLLSVERRTSEIAHQARIEAERRENEARVDAEVARAESLKTRQDAQEARDRLSRVKAAVEALRFAVFAIEPAQADRLREQIAQIDRALAGVEVRPVLTEERAREMVRDALQSGWTGARFPGIEDAPLVALLLRISRGDFGEPPREPPREPAAEHQPGCAHGGCDLCNGEPRTDLAALADAIEANGRTWQRVEPSTLAKALRAVDRRMGTLEAAVTALAASVDQVQAKAGIGEARHVVAGMDPPDEDRLLAAHRRVEAIADPAERHEGRRRLSVSWSSPRTAVERGAAIDMARREVIWPGGDRYPISPENVTELVGGFVTLNKPGEFVTSPQQGDGSGRLVLGTIDGQPIRARYTGVTPTEPRKP